MARWALLLLLLSGTAKAEWTTTDSALLAGALTLQAIDWGQTRAAMRHGGYTEKNPILGPQPSIGRLDKVCTLAMVGTVGLAYVLPPLYRRAFLGGVVTIEAAIVYRHRQLGLRVDF